MENYNGIAISKNDKEFVVAFDNFVNGKMQSATNTGKALATIHRYLQSQAFKVCVAYFRQLAVNYRTGYYDERNETAARRAAMMYDTLMNGDEIYDPRKGRRRRGIQKGESWLRLFGAPDEKAFCLGALTHQLQQLFVRIVNGHVMVIAAEGHERIVGSDEDGKRGVGSCALFETACQVLGGSVQDPGFAVRAHLQVIIAVQPDEDPGELPTDLIKPGQEISLRLEVLTGGSGRDLLRQDIDQPVGLRQKILYDISLVHSETNLGNLQINKNCQDGLLTG